MLYLSLICNKPLSNMKGIYSARSYSRIVQNNSDGKQIIEIVDKQFTLSKLTAL